MGIARLFAIGHGFKLFIVIIKYVKYHENGF